MQFIQEHTIDKVVDRMAVKANRLEQLIERLEHQQPVLLAYLFSEEFDFLTKTEREYMTYLAIVIWQSIVREVGFVGRLESAVIGSCEERNWEVMKSVKARNFRDRISPFFEDYAQEDLLAFVEDALIYEEEEPVVTTEGREYVFIALKSIIDAFHASLKPAHR